MNAKLIFKCLVIGVFLCCGLLSNCTFSVENIKGTYVLSKSNYIIDTLILYKDTIYKDVLNSKEAFRFKQKFYNKNTGKLIFENSGKWWLNGKRIEFLDFYFNYDNDPLNYSYSQESIKSALTIFSTELDNKGNILLDKNVYYKKNQTAPYKDRQRLQNR